MSCEIIGITDRTYRNWKKNGIEDKRIEHDNYVSPIAYTAEEKALIVKRFNQPDVADLSIEQAYYYILDSDKTTYGLYLLYADF